MKRFCKIHFTILMISTLLLNGCAKSSPTENIIDNHIGMVNNALEYAYNNIEQTKDVIFLENELEMCKTGLESAKQSYYMAVDGLESKIDYWRLVSLFLGLIIVGGLLVKIKKII